MKQWSIGKRTTTGFALAFLFIVALGALIWRTTAVNQASTATVSHARDISDQVQYFFSSLQDVESAQSSYALTGDAAFLGLFEAARKNADTQIAEARRLTSDTPALQHHIDLLVPIIAQRMESAKAVIAARKSNGIEAAQALTASGECRILTEKLRTASNQILEEADVLQRTHRAEAEASSKRSNLVAIAGALLAAILLSVISWLIVRSVSRELAQGRSETSQTSGAAGEISRIAEAVSKESDAQLTSLDQGVSSVNEMAASLKETSTQADSVAASTEELVSSINEMAASIEQVTANSTSVAASVAETAAAIEESAASIQNVATSAQEMAASAQQVTASATQMAGSVKSVKNDTDALTSCVEETAAAAEEMARSIQGVATNASDLTAAAEESASSMNEMASSIEEVSATAENLAGIIVQVATSIEQTARSVEGVAVNAGKITDAAGIAATSSGQLDRSIRSVASLAKQADEISRRAGREAEEGGALIEKSIQGFSRVSESMNDSAGAVRQLGQRTLEISGIVDTITLIAERTNLLSLNASIEAARAGEAGRGFAVVAEEIRNLADRAAKATGDIAGIIKGLQTVVQEAVSKSDNGLRVSEEGGKLAQDGLAGLRRILASVQETSVVVAQITNSTEEQIAASQHVVASVNAMAAQSGQVSMATAEQSRVVQGVVKSSTQMRQIAQQVSQAMAEQTRAARDVIKAAENTTSLAAQVRRATGEQAASADQIRQAVESMRKGAVTTARGVAEQATATEQIGKEATRLAQIIAGVSKATTEQATSAKQISVSASDMRRQTEQAARAVAEQSRAARDMSTAAQNVSKQITMITRANRDQSAAATKTILQFSDIRAITERNAKGVKETRLASSSLLERARNLSVMMDRLGGAETAATIAHLN